MNEIEKYYKSVFQEVLEKLDSDIRRGLSLMSGEDLEALKISKLDIERLRIDSIVGNLCYVHESIEDFVRDIKDRMVLSDERMVIYNRQKKALRNAEKNPAIYRAMAIFLCRDDILGSDVSYEEKWDYLSYVKNSMNSSVVSCGRGPIARKLVREK